MKIGYARVSTQDQNLDMQIDFLKAQGAEVIYQEKISATKERPEMKKCLKNLRTGDTLIVLKLDRLGRSVKDLIQIVDIVKGKGANLKTSDGIDTTSALGTFVFHIFSALAEMELSMIRERTKIGLAAARARGRVGGRPRGISPKHKIKAQTIKTMYENNIPIDDICSTMTISRGTLYSLIKSIGIIPRKFSTN